MAREIAIRVPSEIGAWVRQQSGSASQVVYRLGQNLLDSKHTLSLVDPGAGLDRLKIRLQSDEFSFIRAATHSRDTTAAVRKLLVWGAEGRALPENRRAALRVQNISVSRVPVVALAKPESRALSAKRECWDGVVVPVGVVPSYPSCRMPVALYRLAPVNSDWQAAVSGGSAEQRSAPARGPSFLELALVPVALFGGLFLLFRYFGGKAVVGAASAHGAAPVIARWIPQIAKGLGAMFV